MAEAMDKEQLLYQNLKDAGCSQETIQQCMALAHENNMRELILQLTKHRKCLLSQLHSHQKEIDCLDYLIYSTENKKTAL